MPITNGYCTLAQVRAHLGYQTAETGDDTALEAAVEAASREIDAYCGRRFWQDGTVVTREYWACSPRTVETDDISTTTGLIVKLDSDADGTYETTLTATTDYVLLPTNAADRVPAWPYEELLAPGDTYTFPMPSNGRAAVQVTAKFGWPAVPDDVELACVIQAAQLFKAKEAIFGAIALGESASRLVPAMDRQAMALIADYRKPAVG